MRNRFFMGRQGINEPFDVFLTDLKELIGECTFEADPIELKNSLIRDNKGHYYLQW